MDTKEELKKCAWEVILINQLQLHGRLTETMAMNYTTRSRSTVRKYFKKLVKIGKARHDLFRGEPAIILPLA